MNEELFFNLTTSGKSSALYYMSVNFLGIEVGTQYLITRLHNTASIGDTVLVKELLGKGIYPDSKDI